MKKFLSFFIIFIFGAGFGFYSPKLVKLYNKKQNEIKFTNYDTKNIDQSKKTVKVRMVNSSYIEYPIKTIHYILEEKFNVKYVYDDSYDILINQPLHHNEYNFKENAVKIFFTGESITPDIEKYDLSIGFDYIDHKKYIRIPLVFMDYFSALKTENLKNISPKYNREEKFSKCNPSKEYFACFLVSNGSYKAGAQERIELFHHLSLYKKVASGGLFLNNIGKVVPFDESLDFLSKCKFTIAYENNSKYPGYITEKLYQAYLAGSVPIYNGHKTVLSDINKSAIIYSGDFANTEELVDHIKKIDQDDETYCKIWNENLFTNDDMSYDAVYKRLQKKIYEVLDEKLILK